MLPLKPFFACACACALSASAFFARPAAADDARPCISASTAGQEQRDHGKYRAARASFVACARESCPAPVRRDCSQWLSALDDAMPSILIAATDAAGRDLDDVRVTIDGEALLSPLDGMPKPIDPGPHDVRCESPGRGVVDMPIVVRTGEKNRLVRVRFAPTVSPPAATATVPDARQEPPRSAEPVLAVVFGALAVAAFGSEAYFGVSGIEQRNRDTAPGACAPDCPPSEKSDVQTKFLVADVSLGVGVVAAAAAVYFFVRSLEKGRVPSTSMAAGPPLGAGLVLSRF